MTKQQARKSVGRIVSWPDMDARIDCTKTILERVGAHGVSTISYSVEHRPERFITYKHVAELTVEA